MFNHSNHHQLGQMSDVRVRPDYGEEKFSLTHKKISIVRRQVSLCRTIFLEEKQCSFWQNAHTNQINCSTSQYSPWDLECFSIETPFLPILLQMVTFTRIVFVPVILLSDRSFPRRHHYQPEELTHMWPHFRSLSRCFQLIFSSEHILIGIYETVRFVPKNV